MKDNFEPFNVPCENDGSVTIKIQHYQAEFWQQNLEWEYGQPVIKKNDKGTECDRYWRIVYEF